MRIATGSTLSATTRGGKNLVLEKNKVFFLNLNKLETEPVSQYLGQQAGCVREDCRRLGQREEVSGES